MFGRLKPVVPPSHEYYENLTNELTRHEIVFEAENDLLELARNIKIVRRVVNIKRVGWFVINSLGWGLNAHGFSGLNYRSEQSSSDMVWDEEDIDDDGY